FEYLIVKDIVAKLVELAADAPVVHQRSFQCWLKLNSASNGSYLLDMGDVTAIQAFLHHMVGTADQNSLEAVNSHSAAGRINVENPIRLKCGPRGAKEGIHLGDWNFHGSLGQQCCYLGSHPVFVIQPILLQ